MVWGEGFPKLEYMAVAGCHAPHKAPLRTKSQTEPYVSTRFPPRSCCTSCTRLGRQ